MADKRAEKINSEIERQLEERNEGVTSGNALFNTPTGVYK